MVQSSPICNGIFYFTKLDGRPRNREINFSGLLRPAPTYKSWCVAHRLVSRKEGLPSHAALDGPFSHNDEYPPSILGLPIGSNSRGGKILSTSSSLHLHIYSFSERSADRTYPHKPERLFDFGRYMS